ncbi:hypothetical protein HaLaN_30481 [Haematococcus lacustris]|uniref:Uncharacterized protein n=1 Tax=Haematococcus lacustris TaxID=44745 RepID=A0A6A0AFK5_HAELA|nr:hypothetical protein HaLaN_30481 [Haematococcus lacustris]
MSPNKKRKCPDSPAPSTAVGTTRQSDSDCACAVPMSAGASGSGQQALSDEGHGDKKVAGQRRQFIKAAYVPPNSPPPA